MKNNVQIIAVAVAVLIMLFPLAYSLLYPLVSQGTENLPVFLEKPAGSCVANTAYMRYHHMDLLREVRNEAVREGVRGRMGLNDQEVTLNNCLNCHTSRERFCNQCHRAVNLRVNCFNCHYDPELNAETGD